MKKLLATLIMLPMALGAFAAGQDDASGAAADEFMEIEWLMRIRSEEDTTWFMEQLEEKFNVDIIPTGVSAYDNEKMQVMIAAGDWPDFGYWGSDRVSPVDMYENGLIRGLPKAMIAEHMPFYTDLLDERYPHVWQIMYTNLENDDEYLNITRITPGKDIPPYGVTTRVDWARNVGIEFPDYQETKIPLSETGKIFFYPVDQTIEDLERLLVAYRDGDPDGNGKNDTIPFSGSQEFYWANLGFEGVYGWIWGPVVENGQLTSGEISENFRNWLRLQASWYDMGLIDNEFATINRTKLFEKVEAGIVAATGTNMGYIDQGWAAARPPNTLVVEEGAEALMFPSIVGPNGERGFKTENPIPGSPDNVAMAGRQVSDAKLVRILQIIDYMGFNPDTWVESNFGLEGVHFDWEAEPGESRILLRDFENVPDGYPKVGKFEPAAPKAMRVEDLKYTTPPLIAEFHANYTFGPDAPARQIPVRYDLFNDAEFAEIKSRVGASMSQFWRRGPGIDTMVQEYYAKVLVGELDVDASWDDWVKRWSDAGGAELIEGYKLLPLLEPALRGEIVY